MNDEKPPSFQRLSRVERLYTLVIVGACRRFFSRRQRRYGSWRIACFPSDIRGFDYRTLKTLKTLETLGTSDMALKNTTGFERPLAGAAASLLLLAASGQASATLVDLGACTGANACNITNTPPNPVTQDPDDGILLAWDEVQNSTLAEDLAVDRVFDETASFIKEVSGELFIEAGTIVSSHYLQWDPGLGSATRVDTTISLDSQVFAFITDTQKLFDSDDALGLAGIDYNDFGLRGLESGDTTVFNGANVDISWSASSPGDWTRLITAFSPGGVGDNGDNQVPEPASFALVGLGLAGMGVSRKRAWKR